MILPIVTDTIGTSLIYSYQTNHTITSVNPPSCYATGKTATSYTLSSAKQRNKNEIKKSIS